MKLLFYDFEVFKFNWMVVIINYETKEKYIIIDDSDNLKQFYTEHKDDIWIGYNSRMYDQFILKGILLGMNPYLINTEIIENNKNGYQVVRDSEKFPLNNFDISTGFHGLKQLEGFMGSMIKETSIPFDIGRKLKRNEINEVITYCTHDVEQTIEVFNNRKEEFDSQLALIQAFNLDMGKFNKTKAQLSAYVLGAVRHEPREDEFEITIPDTLIISKYKYILDWYKSPDNMNYLKSLNTTVAGVPHIFAWGGIHGAIPNYSDEGIILCCDVSSLYPSVMIEYNYLSRNVTEPNKYKEIRDTRLKLKAEKNPMQLPYKIVLNSTYGAMKDKHNDLFDPLMANNVCVAGQLLLLDLIEKIEPYCKLIQSNTDGLFMKVNDMDTVDKIKAIAKEWETRTRLNLEWDIYEKIYQKDVNNYIIIDKNGKYKSKGSYVKKLKNIDYDLPIVNKALINYFVQNKSIEDTINECDDLREFQKIVKVSSLYKYALYGNEKLSEKVLRVFASTDENAKGVYKVKAEDKIEKIANTPEKCFLYNDNVLNVKVPGHLDKQYYINVAKKRLDDFMSTKNITKTPKLHSDIKYISAEVKEKIIEMQDMEFNTFTDLLLYLTEGNLEINSKQISIMIQLNYFNKFGGNKKLLHIYEMFHKRYKKTLKQEIKNVRLKEIKDYEKSLEDERLPIMEQIKIEIDLIGNIQSTYDLPKQFLYVTNVDKTYSPKLNCYCLNSGKSEILKVDKKTFNKNKIQVGDIIRFKKIISKPKSKLIDGKWQPIEGTKEWWLIDYDIKNEFKNKL